MRTSIAVKTDCNSRYVRLDPYEGGKAAVAEAARNVGCTGARPLGVTDCLNFGSPERPAVFHQFKEACRGIADACRALDTPVTGGNVSFYNESPSAGWSITWSPGRSAGCSAPRTIARRAAWASRSPRWR